MVDIFSGLFDNTFNGIQKQLVLTHRRNQAITSNIANAETHGYRSVDLNFADELERAFKGQYSNQDKLHPSHQPLRVEGTAAFLAQDFSGPTKNDGNNVDIDIQMGKLVRNSGKYQGATAMVRKKLQILRNAIRFAQR